MRRADSTASAAVPTIGVSLVILALGGLARMAETHGGPPGLTMALDPARSRSLPDLWGQLLLAAAVAILLWPRRAPLPGAGLAALLPMALLAADACDLPARLTHLLAPLLPPLAVGGAKLAASMLLGGTALAPTLMLWRRSCLVQRRLGRRLASILMLGGILSSLLDAMGAGRGQEFAVAEEAIELLLYSSLSACLIGFAAWHHVDERLITRLVRERSRFRRAMVT
jgi:hypothetical protein